MGLWPVLLVEDGDHHTVEESSQPGNAGLTYNAIEPLAKLANGSILLLIEDAPGNPDPGSTGLGQASGDTGAISAAV